MAITYNIAAPVDSEGKPWKIGDLFSVGDDTTARKIKSMLISQDGWRVNPDNRCGGIEACNIRRFQDSQETWIRDFERTKSGETCYSAQTMLERAWSLKAETLK